MKTYLLFVIALIAVLAILYIINQAVKRGQHVVISLPPASVEFKKD